MGLVHGLIEILDLPYFKTSIQSLPVRFFALVNLHQSSRQIRKKIKKKHAHISILLVWIFFSFYCFFVMSLMFR